MRVRVVAVACGLGYNRSGLVLLIDIHIVWTEFRTSFAKTPCAKEEERCYVTWFRHAEHPS